MKRIKNIPFEYNNEFGGLTISVNQFRKVYDIYSFDLNGKVLDEAHFTNKVQALNAFNILANRLESLCQIQ
jgi:hypothetical protein